MAVSATTGKLCKRIEDMQIGDYIKVSIISANPWNRCWTIKEMEYPESPVTGATSGNRFLYFIKVAKGLLVGDRITNHSKSWDVLNKDKLIQGLPSIIEGENGNYSGIFRSLTGGCAYADVNGNLSLTDKGFGAWPTNNEWDKYIVQFPEEFIQEGKTLDDVFHWSGALSWCQDTPVNGLVHVDDGGNSVVGSSARRVRRGWKQSHTLSHGQSSSADQNIGFRPVFEYRE